MCVCVCLCARVHDVALAIHLVKELVHSSVQSRRGFLVAVVSFIFVLGDDARSNLIGVRQSAHASFCVAFASLASGSTPMR